MSQDKDVLATAGLVIAIVTLVVGVTTPEIRCFIGLQSDTCPKENSLYQDDSSSLASPHLPIPTPEPTPPLPSPTAPLRLSPSPAPKLSPSPFPISIDYSKLEDFLGAGDWDKADEETMRVMLRATGIKVDDLTQAGNLNENEQETFPCDTLHKINDLWDSYSGGEFSFSVQKRIYLECGGSVNGISENGHNCWLKRVGWKNNDDWFDKVSDGNAFAPNRSLPAVVPTPVWYGLNWPLSSFIRRCIQCEIP